MEEKIFNVFLQLVKQFRNSIANFNDFGLSLQNFITLKFIYDEWKVFQKDIAGYLNITNASTSVVVKKLLEKNYIVKKEDKSDKRYCSIVLSTDWLNFMKEIKQKKILPIANDIFGKLTKEEQKILYKLFTKIVK